MAKTSKSMAQAAIGAIPLRATSRPPFFSSLFISISSFSSSSSSFRSRALRPTIKLLPNEKDDDPKQNDLPTKKSRNELKIEARRSVKWGMELGKFSPPQIKRVLRNAKASLLPSQLRSDARISSIWLKVPSPELERLLKIKEHLEASPSLKKLLLMLVLFGTSMVIAGAVVTPAMSVMSAVGGLRVGTSFVEQGN